MCTVMQVGTVAALRSIRAKPSQSKMAIFLSIQTTVPRTLTKLLCKRTNIL